MKTADWKGNILLPAVFVALAGLAGCGGDTNIVQGPTTVSKGQELTDLQRALQEGAITQGEYDTLRARILRRPN
jgi:hypothetical protein